MTGSFNFVLHLIAFGVLMAAVIALDVLNRKMVSENDLGRKLYIGGIMKTFGLFTPFTAVVLLLTGFGNMVNRYGMGGMGNIETWLEVKIILFVILAFNGGFVASRFQKKRMMLIKATADNAAPEDAGRQIAKINGIFSMYFYVQYALLLAVLLLSVFGDGKHPGTF